MTAVRRATLAVAMIVLAAESGRAQRNAAPTEAFKASLQKRRGA